MAIESTNEKTGETSKHSYNAAKWFNVFNKVFWRAAGQAKKAADWLLNNAGLNTNESVAA